MFWPKSDELIQMSKDWVAVREVAGPVSQNYFTSGFLAKKLSNAQELETIRRQVTGFRHKMLVTRECLRWKSVTATGLHYTRFLAALERFFYDVFDDEWYFKKILKWFQGVLIDENVSFLCRV